MWTFYILHSVSTDKYYIGFTGDLIAERLRKHNTHHKGFTSNSNDWKVVYTEKYFTKAEAIHREKEVKKWR